MGVFGLLRNNNGKLDIHMKNFNLNKENSLKEKAVSLLFKIIQKMDSNIIMNILRNGEKILLVI
ncbi:MAG: hypothetical protein CO137_02825 [Candidatus Magasanikbacteria bacterium CG_4_9_14_3_um_filter_32_9]|uniref:Uncharacterized protein n=1 Tax=Candidatus Magasanikbacteria bacterium CG_4_9_14_3_um_filter_32_9 TaxID=1974644 RepID=A0A2M7Z6D1_9BACT|nr:MAG: hypothetical protein CO137_02825 [Candidatus Magasanikbacteria bacterium CG_4_9_14_3_um_filter_32_9]